MPAVARRLVTVYSRTSCGLCDAAREAVLALLAEADFRYVEVFVDGREDLERQYGSRVPVVLVDGREEFEGHVDPERLRALLAGTA